MNKIRLYLVGEKGLHVLQSLESELGASSIACVILNKDKNVQNDYYNEMKDFCLSKGIFFLNRTDKIEIDRGYSFAVGWQYIISGEEKLIVFHDSLLPRYRGFNPLVTALINGDDKIGVTALFATANYDCGDIIEQREISVNYPLKISEAIFKIKFIYSAVAVSIAQKILGGEILGATKQNESLATYSLWRDELDYFIDWNWDALKISRLVDAVGIPYKGAQAYVDETRVVINQAIPVADIIIENRITGKVVMIENGHPVIVCGTGLLKLLDVKIYETDKSLLPLKKFRTRFSNSCNL